MVNGEFPTFLFQSIHLDVLRLKLYAMDLLNILAKMLIFFTYSGGSGGK
ncbi:hypothetical protein JOC75_004437 [Metabacillus crassostreae]|nr:hypothetical protein [Metabacillus crassostreae]MBM7606389.1 hypothetical protein [Metabacillus crassostreae]